MATVSVTNVEDQNNDAELPCPSNSGSGFSIGLNILETYRDDCSFLEEYARLLCNKLRMAYQMKNFAFFFDKAAQMPMCDQATQVMSMFCIWDLMHGLALLSVDKEGT